MKLLLRSGADPSLHNALEKTPLEIAQEKGHKTCEDLVSIITEMKNYSLDLRIPLYHFICANLITTELGILHFLH